MFIFNFRKLPKAFLLAVLIIITFESFVWILDQRYYLSEVPTEGLRIKIKNRLSQASGNHFDVLIFGDCYPHLGIQPKIIEQRTGLTCYNFSTYVWQTALSSYAMLRNYVQHSSKPKVIILSFNSWGAAFSKGDIFKERMPFFYEFAQGNEDIFIQEFGFAQGVKFAIPSVGKQEVLQKIIRSPFHVSLGNPKAINDFIATVQNDGGFDPSYMDAPYNYWRMTTQQYPLSLFFKRYVISILELAQKNNIPVIYLKPTLPQDYYEFEEKKYHVSELYNGFIALLSNHYSNMIILNPQEMLGDPVYYQSKQHLNRKGSLVLSEYLAAEIKNSRFK